MPLIPPETIEQIQSANDIVEVVGGYLTLKRAAGVFKARCPFHEEKTPSFSVNPKRQTFKCFGCGAGGSVFRFVMEYEKIDFVSAVRKLAARAGIIIVEGELSAEDHERYNMRRRLLSLHAETADFFHFHLMKKPSAQVARDYLKSRGVSVDIAKAWKLGYAPEGQNVFIAFARDRGFSVEEMIVSGIVAEPREDNPHGNLYERFRGRVMFPICNDNDEVIAFSGRALDPEARAKYLNSPETPLFNKGSVLFGLNRSKRAMIGKSSAIICEGQLDLITAFESGVQNVIASQGTAFTDKQAHLLKRFVDEVILCFDSDAAGENAAVKSLPFLLAEGLVVRVAQMPPGEDPDSLIRSQGPDAFVQRIAAARDFFDFQLDRLMAAPDFSNPRGKLAAIRKIAESISLISDSIQRETVVNRAAQRLEISSQEFVRILKAPKKEKEAEQTEKIAPEPTLLDPTLRLLALVSLCDDDTRAWIFEEPWNELLAREPDAGLLIKILEADIQPSHQPSVSAFLTTLEPGEEAAVTELLEIKPPQNALTIAHDCWRALEARQARRRIEAIQARMRSPDLSAEDVDALQKQVSDLRGKLATGGVSGAVTY